MSISEVVVPYNKMTIEITVGLSPVVHFWMDGMEVYKIEFAEIVRPNQSLHLSIEGMSGEFTYPCSSAV